MAERKESVRVSASGDDFKREFRAFTREAAELNAALRALPNKVTVKAEARGFDAVEQQARRAERSSSLLVDTAIGLGPAFLPVGAVAIPALAGLSAQLGFTVAAAGTAVLAFNGVGDALKALDDYQLEPSTANLEKLNQTLDKLGPSGRRFVRELDAIEPQLKQIKIAAEDGLLPGVSEGIDSLLTRLPQIRSFVSEVASASGQLASEAGAGLAGRDYDDFFAYLQTEAKPILLDLGHTLGAVATGFADLFAGTGPQQRQFSQFLLNTARDFEQWTDGIEDTQGFNDLMDYIDQNGPKLAAALGSIGNALVQVAQAAAPLSGPVLQGLQAVADVIAKIADSPIGTPLITLASGLALLNRALVARDLARGSTIGQLLSGRATGIERSRTSIRALTTDLRTANSLGAFAGTRALATPAQLEAQAAAAGRLSGRLTSLAKGTAVMGGLAVATSGLTDEIGLTNTTTLALAGSFAGPFGAAAGAATGAFLDLKEAGEGFSDGLELLHDAVARGDLDAAAKQAQNLNAELDDLNRHSGLKDSLADIFKLQSGILNGDLKGDSLGAKGGLLGEFAGSGGGLIGGLIGRDQQVTSPKLRAEVDALDAKRELAALNTEAILAAQGLRTTATGASELTYTSKQMADALNKGSAALSQDAALSNYRAAVDNMTESLKQNGKTLDTNTPKGRANFASLQAIAQGARDAADGLKGVGQTKFLDRARDQFIASAKAAGLGAEAAKKMADRYGLLNRLRVAPKVDDRAARAKFEAILGLSREVGRQRPTPKVGLDNKASPILKLIADQLAAIKDKNVTVTTNYVNRTAPGKRPLAQGQQGGTVSGGNSRAATAPERTFSTSSASPRPIINVAAPSLEGMTITGTLNTPWGPAEVSGIARAEAEIVYHQQEGMKGTLARASAAPRIPGNWP